jgi:hypothetical protein
MPVCLDLSLDNYPTRVEAALVMQPVLDNSFHGKVKLKGALVIQLRTMAFLAERKLPLPHNLSWRKAVLAGSKAALVKHPVLENSLPCKFVC